MTATPFRRETTVSVRNLELFVREQGEGHPLLLVNGLGGNVEMWGRLEERLAAVARTITFDAPGTGRSQTPFRWRSMAELAELVWEALDGLGYERVDILGYSLGGALAQQLAHEQPQRVRRLALAATGCGWGSVPGTLPALCLMAMPLRYYSRSFYEHTNRLLSYADAAEGARGGLSHQEEARLKHPPSFLGYAYQLWAGALFSSIRWLPSLDVPTLVLTGDADHLVPPANSIQLARLLPVSRLQLVPDEGHLFLFDEDSPSGDLLLDWFGARSTEGSRTWVTGQEISDDAIVHAAFAGAVGAQPFRALSDLFRKLAA